MDDVVCWVVSEAASEGTPLNVENRLEVRFEETYNVMTSQRRNVKERIDEQIGLPEESRPRTGAM